LTKPNFSKALTSAKNYLSKHAPGILTGIGTAGMITTTILAVKATPKALRLLEEKKSELETDKLTLKETVATTWKCYAPAAATCALSATCIIGASSVNARRNAVLTTAYKLSETAFQEYRESVVDAVGEKKERAIRENLSQKRLDQHPVSRSEVILTEKGNTLFCESTSKRYFKSDIDHINKVVNALNKRMISDMTGSISLNDFYYEIGLSSTSLGDALGWNVVDGLIEIELTAGKADDGNPCLVIEYERPPKYDFE
jgi:hypothetical protein